MFCKIGSLTESGIADIISVEISDARKAGDSA